MMDILLLLLNFKDEKQTGREKNLHRLYVSMQQQQPQHMRQTFFLPSTPENSQQILILKRDSVVQYKYS